jgi:hypothetical protein
MEDIETLSAKDERLGPSFMARTAAKHPPNKDSANPV